MDIKGKLEREVQVGKDSFREILTEQIKDQFSSWIKGGFEEESHMKTNDKENQPGVMLLNRHVVFSSLE